MLCDSNLNYGLLEMMVHGCLSNEKILDKFQESNMYVYGEE